ncbi:MULTISPECIES: hypothetical protein [unclassified Rhodanobacter]|uniref:hypothetical protein n=1 Tax=unclassified Rhodanobacter TaxID=2621553 RepID=UPI000A9BB96B|nr:MULTISPECIES: hypothetical protein [unclassified Rhodanobacter]
MQLHPKSHTHHENALLKRFVSTSAAAPHAVNAVNIFEDQIERVRGEVGNDTVLLGLPVA